MTSNDSRMETFFSRHRDLLVCLCLIVATLAVYWQVKGHEFVHYDDYEYVTGNRYVRAGFTSKSITWAFTSFNYWQPLTWLSHMLDYELYGMNAGWHHLTNVFFHIANTVLLFLVFKRMTGVLWRSAFVAALFALHPLHVESVAWVAERKDVLSTFFWMLTMWSYVRYVGRPVVKRYLLVLLFFVFGLMTKPMLVTLPFILLLLDYWPLGRLQLGQSGDGSDSQQRPFLRLLWEKAPFIILAAISSVVTALATTEASEALLLQLGESAIAPLRQYSLGVKIANAVVSYISYLSKTVWPFQLAVYYPHPGLRPAWQVAGAGSLLVFVSVLAIRDIRRRPYFTMGWLWYIGTLVPVIGLVQAGTYAMADRYTYVTLTGVFIIVAWFVPELVARWRYSKIVLATAAAVVLSLLMTRTWPQVRYWTNGVTLFEHTLDSTANNYEAHYNLGLALANEGRFDEAISHYSEALRIEPGYAAAHNNLGLALAVQGKLKEAISHYSEGLRIRPNSSRLHNNLGAALAAQGRFDDAISHYSEALRIRPDYLSAHNNLGLALAMQGKFDDAISHYSEALRIKPDYAPAHYNLGLALTAQGKFDDAISHYSEALRTKPDFVKAQNKLYMAHTRVGLALVAQGKFDDAISHYSEALRIKPDQVQAYYNLGNILANLGRIEEALEHFREALRLEPNNPTLHYTLGNLYRMKGELDEAIRQYQEALSIRPEYTNALNNMASVYAAQGKFDRALSLYMKLRHLQPDSNVPYYNIACVYSQQGKIEESIDWLKQAIEKGFDDWEFLKTDKDLENIRTSEYYKELTLTD